MNHSFLIYNYTRLLADYVKREKLPGSKYWSLSFLVQSNHSVARFMPDGTHYELWQIYIDAIGFCRSVFNIVKPCTQAIGIMAIRPCTEYSYCPFNHYFFSGRLNYINYATVNSVFRQHAGYNRKIKKYFERWHTFH